MSKVIKEKPNHHSECFNRKNAINAKVFPTKLGPKCQGKLENSQKKHIKQQIETSLFNCNLRFTIKASNTMPIN
jgi:hypothetical protein